MKNRVWIIIFSATAVLCLLIYSFASGAFFSGNTAGIYQNGELIEKINLDSLTEERQIVLNGDAGQNIILAENGSIKMLSAECPDRVCVKHGELRKGGTPIVCLPNKIVIQFEDSPPEYDAKTGE